MLEFLLFDSVFIASLFQKNLKNCGRLYLVFISMNSLTFKKITDFALRSSVSRKAIG